MLDKLRRFLRPDDQDREKEDEVKEQEQGALPLGDEGDTAATARHQTVATGGEAVTPSAAPPTSSSPPPQQAAPEVGLPLQDASLPVPDGPPPDHLDATLAAAIPPDGQAMAASTPDAPTGEIAPASQAPLPDNLTGKPADEARLPEDPAPSTSGEEQGSALLSPFPAEEPPNEPGEGGDQFPDIRGAFSDDGAPRNPLLARLEASATAPAPPLVPGAAQPLDTTPADLQAIETPASDARAADSADTAHAIERGVVVGSRYTIISRAEDVVEGAADEVRYLATDTMAYQRCWSCGSIENTQGMRFCQSCGAGLLDHPVVLAWSAQPTGVRDELAVPGGYLHVVAQRRRFGAEGIALQVGAYSAEGPHHPNEDSFWFTLGATCGNSRRISHGVIIFADGMGGYRPGSGLISRHAAEVAGETLWSSLLPYRRQGADAPTEAQVEQLVRAAIGAGNNAVLAEIERLGYEMGCTMIVAVVLGDMAYVANIGDSRVYYISPTGTTEQITEDQSQVGALVKIGQMRPEDVYTAVGNNMILHAIGEPGVAAAAGWSTQPLEPAGLLLLCSDGYWKTERGVGAAVEMIAQSPSLDEAAREMVNDALDRNSDDNTTVIIVRVD